MANHKSAIRQWRKNLRRNKINKKNKSILHTQIKKLRESIEDNDKENAEKLLSETFSIIDRSVKKGAIHKNTGSRYKSRLSRQISLIGSAPVE